VPYRFALGLFAAGLNLYGYLPYVRDIFRGIVKPHRATWGIWAVLTTIGAINQLHNGGGASTMFFVVAAFFDVVIFIAAIRYGVGGTESIDKVCMALALALLVYWLGVRDFRLSTVMAVGIDALGFIPTIIKTRRDPGSETYPQWVCAAIAGALTIAAVGKADWVLYVYPAYALVFHSLVALTKYSVEHKS
jgi:hypothetical protein